MGAGPGSKDNGVTAPHGFAAILLQVANHRFRGTKLLQLRPLVCVANQCSCLMLAIRDFL